MPNFIIYIQNTLFIFIFIISGIVNDVPTRYQIVANNDRNCGKDSAWNIICEDLSGAKVSYRYTTKRCVMEDHKKRFRCYGIRILGTTYDNSPYVGVSNVRFFKITNH